MDSTTINEETASCTTGQMIRFSHCWTIKNFSMHLKAKEKHHEYLILDSAKFAPPTNDRLVFHLSLLPHGDRRQGNRGYASVYVVVDKMGSHQELLLNIEFFIYNVLGIRRRICDCQRKFSKSGNKTWGFPQFISHRSLLYEGWLKEDSLQIEAEISYLANVVTLSVPANNINVHLRASECEARNDLLGMLESGANSDLTLVVADTEFAVHKSVLAVRCPVLVERFEDSDQIRPSSKSDRIILDDMQPDVARHLLRFIYGAVPHENKHRTAELFKAADKYKLDLLKQICEQSLMEQMTTKNAIDLLVLADTYKSELLKAAAIDYIASHISAIISTGTWKTLAQSRPQLYHESISHLIPKLSMAALLDEK